MNHCIWIELANDTKPAPMTLGEPRKSVRAIRSVAGKNALSIRKPPHPHGQQALHQFRRSLVTAPFFGIDLRSSIQRHKNRECPSSRRAWYPHPQRKNAPLMSPMDDVSMGRPHRISVTTFSVDVFASMLTDGFVAHNLKRTARGKMIDQGPYQRSCQNRSSPATMRKDAMKRREVTRNQSFG